MLRQVFILKDGKIIYKRSFGKALDEESFNHVIKVLSKGLFNVQADKLDSYEYLKYRITYTSIYKYRVILMLVTGLADKAQNVKKELEKLKKDFLSNFEMVLNDEVDEETFEIFHSSVDSTHKNLRPKISLVGFSGVGKTTITRLIQANEIPIEHVPTITGDIATIKIGKLHFHLWDFAGQEQFSYLWDNFIKGSDAVLIISDSTLENVEKSKFFIELVKQQAPGAHVACIGNKQDLPDHMPVSDIERHLGVKTYSMVASNPNNRDKMITIIADILDMSAEVSPLLAPLLERDTKLVQAEKAIENGDWSTAIHLYEELAQLCITLGDDNVSKVFMERAAQLQSILQKSQMMTATQTASPPSGTTAAEEPKKQEKTPSEKTDEMPADLAKPAGPQLAPPPGDLARPAGPQLAPPPADLSKPAGPQLAPPPADLSKPAGPQLAPPPADLSKPAGPQLAPPPADLSKPAGPQLAPPPLNLNKPIASELPPVSKSQSEVPKQATQSPSTPPPKPPVQPAPGNIDALSAILANIKSGATPTGQPAAAPNNPIPPIKTNTIGMIDPRAAAIPLANIGTPTIPSQDPKKDLSNNAPAPLSQLNVPTQPITQMAATSPIIPSAMPSASGENQAGQLKKQINDIKLKIINVDNTMLDLELKNISGELSDAEFKEKSERLKKMKETLDTQKSNLEKMLSEGGA